MADFEWTRKRDIVAISLASGDLVKEAADKAGVSERTVYRWQNVPEFQMEVDRLTHMMGVGTRAGRLRLAYRVIKEKTEYQQYPQTRADLLDWLKFIQSETDGIRLDVTALLAAASSMAGSGQARPTELASGIGKNGRETSTD